MKRDIIRTGKAPAPVGAYSQGIRWQDLIFTAGQIPINPETGEIITADFDKAAETALNNMIAVVEAGGGRRDTILKITVFMQDLAQFGAVNSLFDKVFPNDPPARSAVQVARLPKDVPVEMECIAVKA